MEAVKAGRLTKFKNQAGQTYQKCLSDQYTGELLFFAGYILFLWRSVWITTMFPLGGLMTLICVPLAALFVGLKILLYDHYSIKQFFLLGLALACICLVLYSSGSINPFFWLLLIAGSRNIKFEKILKVYLAINVTIVLLAFGASSLDVIENLRYETVNRGTRNSFGIIYPTDFGAHIFFLFLAYFYLKGEKLRHYHYGITILAAALVYYFSNARLDSGCTLALAVLFALGNWISNSRKAGRNLKIWWEREWDRLGVWVMPILAVFSIVLTVIYQRNSSAWQELNDIVSGRLELGRRGIDEYGWSLFGQPLTLVGFGGTVGEQSNYNFIDCSYMYMLLRHGILFVILMVAIFSICCYKNRHDRYFLYAIALVSVNCMIAHHIIQVEYNPFALALLAECVREKNKEKQGAFTIRAEVERDEGGK
ncbi:MAG: hypothetical protein HFG49_13695 [Lachnospiraceae bacterium]|jgi:hypothetical protein|nr:hypothetical protein [Lachnospiraceae bacterium]